MPYTIYILAGLSIPIHKFVVMASFTEIKTGYLGFEKKQNPVFLVLVVCSEN